MKAFQSRWLKPKRRKMASATHKIRAYLAAQALAGRILKRYGLHSQPRLGPGMDYLHANQPSGLPQALRLSLHLSQRIERSSRPPLEMRLPASAPAPASIAAGSPPGSPALALVQLPISARQGRIYLTYLQTFNRLQTVSHQRIEMGSPGAALRPAVQPAAPGKVLPLDRPAQMIARLALAPAAQAANRAAPAEIAPPRSSLADGSAQAIEHAAAGLPPAELRRVTEQVIQEIDRRIIANRERYGRT